MVAEHAFCPRPRAVGFHHAVIHYIPQQIEILFHFSKLKY